MRNESHGNRFDLGASLAKLGAKTTPTLSKNSYGNALKGDLGKVDDNAPKGRQRLLIAPQGWTPPLVWRLFQARER